MKCGRLWTSDSGLPTGPLLIPHSDSFEVSIDNGHGGLPHVLPFLQQIGKGGKDFRGRPSLNSYFLTLDLTLGNKLGLGLGIWTLGFGLVNNQNNQFPMHIRTFV